MLHLLQSEDFRAVLNQSLRLGLPDGSELPVVLDGVSEAPQSRMPASPRMPFSVTLHSLQPTAFVDGLCQLQLPGVDTLRDLYVSRNPPLGRDPQLGYFSIVFN